MPEATQTQTQPQQQLQNNSSKVKGWIIALFLILSLVGFADATYLTITHLSGGVPECTILAGCDVVTTSKYSQIGPIPVAMLGLIYYLAILILSFLYLDIKKEKLFRIASLLTPFGFVASLIFVILQIFVIKSICIYCMGSALISTILFATSIYYWQNNKNLIN